MADRTSVIVMIGSDGAEVGGLTALIAVIGDADEFWRSLEQ
jgi:hypothetical protein